MLKFKIGFTLPDGTEDYVILEGESIQDIREQAQDAVESRHATDAWSEAVL